jgi:hypothetical protein
MQQQIQIQPDAVYDCGSLPNLTGVSADTVKRARLQGNLRAAKRGSRWFAKGSEILAWLVLDEKNSSKNEVPHA